MGAKVTMVRLTAESLGLTKAFDVAHAEALFRRYGDKSGWKIAEGEKVEFTEDGFKFRKDSKGNGESE